MFKSSFYESIFYYFLALFKTKNMEYVWEDLKHFSLNGYREKALLFKSIAAYIWNYEYQRYRSILRQIESIYVTPAMQWLLRCLWSPLIDAGGAGACPRTQVVYPWKNDLDL